MHKHTHAHAHTGLLFTGNQQIVLAVFLSGTARRVATGSQGATRQRSLSTCTELILTLDDESADLKITFQVMGSYEWKFCITILTFHDIYKRLFNGLFDVLSRTFQGVLSTRPYIFLEYYPPFNSTPNQVVVHIICTNRKVLLILRLFDHHYPKIIFIYFNFFCY